jgi:hypothetical protein
MGPMPRTLRGRQSRRLRLAPAVRTLPAWCIAAILGIAFFGLYADTAGRLVGYEGETAAVADGLVEHGQLRVFPNGPFSNSTPGLVVRDGHTYSRTGLTQPLLEAPLIAVGRVMDRISLGRHTQRYVNMLVLLFDPLMASIAMMAVFGFLMLRGMSRRRAILTTVLCGAASIAWPYAKIGMETTLMATLALAFCACAWANQEPRPVRLAIAGFAAGAAAASKPYGVVLVLGLLPLIGPALLDLQSRSRIKAVGAAGVPLLGWIVAIGWYNAYRTGSVTNFGNPFYSEWLATPINAVGMFVSPGKGLLLYSPLAVLGLLGLRMLWRSDRPLARAILVTVIGNTLVLAASSQWGDETWGARYLVPSAWLLVVPIGWWATTPRRRRWTQVVATVAVAIQLVGVLVAYPVGAQGASRLSGEDVYPYGGAHPSHARAAYGPDGPRWIPEVSPLLFQTEVVLAWVKEKLTGTGFVVRYRPYFGRAETVNLLHPERQLNAQIPDFWWDYPNESTASAAVALVLASLGAGAWLIVGSQLSPAKRSPYASAV